MPPRPKEMTPPVWLRMSGWMAKEASTQVINLVRESAPRRRARSLVPRRYSRSRRSFFFILLGGLADASAEESECEEDVGAGTGADVDELGDNAVEGLGALAAEGWGSWVNGEQAAGAWGRGIFGDDEAAVIDGLLDVGRHVDGSCAVTMVGDVHAEELVLAASGYGHFTEFGF